MHRLSAFLLIGSAFAGLMLATLTSGVPTADAAACHFVLGFKALHHQIASVVGACVGDEQHNPTNGDAYQQTKKGMLVWRKADNQVAFTNGYSTILDGPHGLEQRLNTQRFSWEANPDGLPVIPDAPTTASQLRRQAAGTTTISATATCSTTSRAAAKTTAHRTSRKSSKKATPTPAPKPVKKRVTCA